MLFFAFLLVLTAKTASDLDFWARRVLSERSEAEQLRAHWQPRNAEHGGFDERNRVSKLYEPMKIAYLDTSWGDAELNWIGSAMQLWDGPGQRDELRSSQLRNHLRKDDKHVPRGVGKDSKTKGPPRWRTWSIVRVAELIHKRGADLRRTLKLDVSPEQVLPAHERIALAERRCVELETELKAVRRERDKAQNAYRKASVRNADKTETRRLAVKAAKAAELAKVDARVEAARAHARCKADAEAARMLAGCKKVQEKAVAQAAKAQEQAVAARVHAEASIAVAIENKSMQLEQH